MAQTTKVLANNIQQYKAMLKEPYSGIDNLKFTKEGIDLIIALNKSLQEDLTVSFSLKDTLSKVFLTSKIVKPVLSSTPLSARFIGDTTAPKTPHPAPVAVKKERDSRNAPKP